MTEMTGILLSALSILLSLAVILTLVLDRRRDRSGGNSAQWKKHEEKLLKLYDGLEEMILDFENYVKSSKDEILSEQKEATYDKIFDLEKESIISLKDDIKPRPSLDVGISDDGVQYANGSRTDASSTTRQPAWGEQWAASGKTNASSWGTSPSTTATPASGTPTVWAPQTAPAMSQAAATPEQPAPPVKRGRGRPRKHPLPTASTPPAAQSSQSVAMSSTPVQKTQPMSDSRVESPTYVQSPDSPTTVSSAVISSATSSRTSPETERSTPQWSSMTMSEGVDSTDRANHTPQWGSSLDDSSMSDRSQRSVSAPEWARASNDTLKTSGSSSFSGMSGGAATMHSVETDTSSTPWGTGSSGTATTTTDVREGHPQQTIPRTREGHATNTEIMRLLRMGVSVDEISTQLNRNKGEILLIQALLKNN